MEGGASKVADRLTCLNSRLLHGFEKLADLFRFHIRIRADDTDRAIRWRLCRFSTARFRGAPICAFFLFLKLPPPELRINGVFLAPGW